MLPQQYKMLPYKLEENVPCQWDVVWICPWWNWLLLLNMMMGGAVNMMRDNDSKSNRSYIRRWIVAIAQKAKWDNETTPMMMQLCKCRYIIIYFYLHANITQMIWHSWQLRHQLGKLGNNLCIWYGYMRYMDRSVASLCIYVTNTPIFSLVPRQ